MPVPRRWPHASAALPIGRRSSTSRPPRCASGSPAAGDIADIDLAVRLCRDAVALTPDDSRQSVRLSSLALALQDRFARTGNRTDLDEAVQDQSDGVRTAGTDGSLDGLANNLSLALRRRYGLTKSRPDLDQAIELATAAAAAVPPGHPIRAGRLSNLAHALVRQVPARRSGRGHRHRDSRRGTRLHGMANAAAFTRSGVRHVVRRGHRQDAWALYGGAGLRNRRVAAATSGMARHSPQRSGVPAAQGRCLRSARTARRQRLRQAATGSRSSCWKQDVRFSGRSCWRSGPISDLSNVPHRPWPARSATAGTA